MKKISVSIAGADEIKDLELDSGTTAADVLAALNLSNYQLLPDQNGTPFRRTESIYSKVEDGDKLFAVPDSEVGK